MLKQNLISVAGKDGRCESCMLFCRGDSQARSSPNDTTARAYLPVPACLRLCLCLADMVKEALMDAVARPIFDKADADSDGTISLAEVKAVLEGYNLSDANDDLVRLTLRHHIATHATPLPRITHCGPQIGIAVMSAVPVRTSTACAHRSIYLSSSWLVSDHSIHRPPRPRSIQWTRTAMVASTMASSRPSSSQRVC